jgi:hypothetical protein
VVLNLATNAAQAMDMRGTVSIRLSGVAGAGPQGAPCRIARLSVVDHGVGIPADRLVRIFDPFFTTRDGGTGLGLATVRKIVDNHGGRIDVRSDLVAGTMFVVELPLCGPEDAATPDDAKLPRHGTVLVLCEDPAELERLEDMLAALGHEPVGHLEVAAAVSALKEGVGRFDGVLVDRDRTGDTAAAIRALHGAAPELPLILATRAGSLAACPGLGGAIAEIVAQPFGPGVLAQTLERALARPRPKTQRQMTAAPAA